MDPYIRVFDRRYIDSHITKPLKSFCPDLLVNLTNKKKIKNKTFFSYRKKSKIVKDNHLLLLLFIIIMAVVSNSNFDN
jgi:CRISPR/Cas system endoribonuclease Cas6 (RAMP superfamily)